jgi:hypothetical protein
MSAGSPGPRITGRGRGCLRRIAPRSPRRPRTPTPGPPGAARRVPFAERAPDSVALRRPRAPAPGCCDALSRNWVAMSSGRVPTAVSSSAVARRLARQELLAADPALRGNLASTNGPCAGRAHHACCKGDCLGPRTPRRRSRLRRHGDIRRTGRQQQGLALQQLGRFDAAIECFDRLLRSQPDDATARYNRAACLDRPGMGSLRAISGFSPGPGPAPGGLAARPGADRVLTTRCRG